MPTPRRIKKVKKLLSLRQPDLRVVLEGVSIAHNASAVMRTCDAAGVLHVDIISAGQDVPLINRAISTRAEKWIETRVYSAVGDCLKPLQDSGFSVAVTHLGKESLPYTELDFTQPLVLVFGNESEGVSPDALALADFKIMIPMLGMVQSLNLSVSVGIILYEALRQRWDKGFYRQRRLRDEEYEAYLRKWLSGPGENDAGNS